MSEPCAECELPKQVERLKNVLRQARADRDESARLADEWEQKTCALWETLGEIKEPPWHKGMTPAGVELHSDAHDCLWCRINRVLTATYEE